MSVWPVAILISLASLAAVGPAAAESAPPASYYRKFALAVRSQGQFQIPMPSGGNMPYDYSLRLGVPKQLDPLLSDLTIDFSQRTFFRNFWDKVFLQDGSTITIGGEQLPLTCVFVRGQDNRFSGKDTPLLPDFVLKIYLVANDFSCTGPINPNWPHASAKKETWETYLYFEIRDPTIMLPTEIKLRYRWNEFTSFLVDAGGMP